MRMYWLNLFIFSFITSNVFAITVDSQLVQLGFSGLSLWVYALIGIVGGIAISSVLMIKVRQGAAIISNDLLSQDIPNKRLRASLKKESSNFVSYKYRSPIVYRSSYALSKQVYGGISLQFDWSTFDWYVATRGYYKFKPSTVTGLSLNNSKFSARVFDFKSGMWKYELKQNQEVNKDNDSSKDNKENYSAGLVFHSSLTEQQRYSITTNLSNVKTSDKQLVLNLLNNQIDSRLQSKKKAIDKPDIYLRSLVGKYHKGDLDFSLKNNVVKFPVVARSTIGEKSEIKIENKKKLKRSQVLVTLLDRIDHMESRQEAQNIFRELNYGGIFLSTLEKDIAMKEWSVRSLQLETKKDNKDNDDHFMRSVA